MQLKTTIYEASNADRISIRAWKTMFTEMWEYKELTLRLVRRNIAGQFRQSFLGYIWIALPPIAAAIVFTLLRSSDIVNITMSAEAMPYTLFVLINSTIWQFFTQVSTLSTGSIAIGGPLVSKIYFPRETLVVAQVGQAVINLLIQSIVVIITFALLMYIPHWKTIFIPLLLLPVLLLGLGIGLMLAPLNAMMHDVSRILAFAFQFGMFLTPTIYPTPAPDELVNKWKIAIYWIHTLNPVSHVIYAVDALVQGTGFHMGVGFFSSLTVCVVVFLSGWRFFHICEPLVAERL